MAQTCSALNHSALVRAVVAVGIVLALSVAPAGAGTLPPGTDATSTSVTTTTELGSTTSSTSTPEPIPPTTGPAVTWPEPAGRTCSPNWYRGFLLGTVVENGEEPAIAEGEARSASDVGAIVAITSRLVVDGGEAAYSVTEVRLDITVDGRTHRLSTAPHPAYGHYANRTPGPFEVSGGTLRVAQVGRRTWVIFEQNTSGATGSFGWDLGACVPVPDPAVPEAPRGAAVPGQAGYTG